MSAVPSLSAGPLRSAVASPALSPSHEDRAQHHRALPAAGSARPGAPGGRMRSRKPRIGRALRTWLCRGPLLFLTAVVTLALVPATGLLPAASAEDPRAVLAAWAGSALVLMASERVRPVGPLLFAARQGVVQLIGLALVAIATGAAPTTVAVLQGATLLIIQGVVDETRRRAAHALDPFRTVLICPAAQVTEASGRFPDAVVRGIDEALLSDARTASRAIRASLPPDASARIMVHPAVPDTVVRHLTWDLREQRTVLHLLVGVRGTAPCRTRLIHHHGQPVVLLGSPRPTWAQRAAKRAVDVMAAGILLVLLLPLLVVIAVAVRREDGGPALFRQERVGLNGATFTIHKFRTMRVGADAQLAALLAQQGRAHSPLFKVHDDPRLTRWGPLLRRSSLDELPQLIDVLRGSMSLVGPRPQRPAEVALYTGADGHRLGVRPGITGLWQVSGRSRLTWDEARELDIHYVHNWSVLGDLRIMLRTAHAVLRADGAV